MRESKQNILSYLERLALTEPGTPLLGCGTRWLDAETVLSLAEHVGSHFRRLGLKSGDLVAFQPGRNMASAVMLLGLRAAGSVILLAEPKQPLDEILAGAGAALPVAARLEQCGTTRFRFTRTGGDKATSEIELYALPPANGLPPAPSSDEMAFIIFTSGSTGKSKAVVLSESNLINNLIDSRPLGDYRTGDRALGCLPLHHVFGLVLLMGAPVLGYGVYFPDHTDPDALLSAIEGQKLTRMNGVPSLYLALADKSEGYDTHTLRSGFIGGGPVTQEQFVYIQNRLGLVLIPVYGMSECIGISCASWQDSLEARACGVGRFYSMNTGKVLREDGREAAPGEEGEIWVTGPARMIGYWGDPLPREELFATGDLGILDGQGVLHLTGRKKEIIIRNGNNLSIRRIEQAILNQPGIRDAVVVALPDLRQGEVPAAMVAADRGIGPITPDLKKHEMPVMYQFVDQLPMTASGKPDRQKIREVLLKCKAG